MFTSFTYNGIEKGTLMNDNVMDNESVEKGSDKEVTTDEKISNDNAASFHSDLTEINNSDTTDNINNNAEKNSSKNEISKAGREKLGFIFKLAGLVILVLLYVYYWLHEDFRTGVVTNYKEIVSDVNASARTIFVTSMVALGGALLFVKNILGDILNKIASVLMFVLTPVVSFFMLEYSNIQQSTLLLDTVRMLGKKRVLTSIVILGLIMLLIYVFTNSTKVSSIFTISFSCVAGIASYYTFSFRGIPLLATDLSSLRTAMNVMSEYDYSLNYFTYAIILLSVVWIIALCKLKSYKGFSWKIRIPITIAYAAIAVFSVNLLFNTDFLDKTVPVRINTFMPQKSYRKYGFVLTFTKSINFLLIEEPEKYSYDKAEAIADKYKTDSNQGYKTPNVIVIMDEAFSDLQSVGKHFNTNEEVTPFFNSLKEDTVRGFAYVSVFGGQTANSEYEFLTGCSKAFLPATSTPYQLFIKDKIPSLTTYLKKQEYQGNIAMHPFRASGYNRETIYPLIGFDRFITMEDFSDAKYVRKFISDETDFKRIINEYENAKKKSDKPFYLFNVTMQNHSGYDEDFDNLPDTIKITDKNFKDAQAERYLNLIHLSDKALESLISYFENVDDDTVIVFFGDHEPGVHEAFYTKLFGKKSSKLKNEQLMEKYKVPFIIWANYDIEERSNINTSLNYLSAIMKDSVGMKKTGFDNFRLDSFQSIPILTVNGYYDKKGQFYSLSDNKKSESYPDILSDYDILQYNYMFDKKHRIDNFFD